MSASAPAPVALAAPIDRETEPLADHAPAWLRARLSPPSAPVPWLPVPWLDVDTMRAAGV